MVLSSGAISRRLLTTLLPLSQLQQRGTWTSIVRVRSTWWLRDIFKAKKVERTLLGFNSKNSAGKPVWGYSVAGNCTVDLTLEGDSKPTLKMSDDGSYGYLCGDRL